MEDALYISVEQRGEIDIVTLNRAENRNAIDPEMVRQLTEYFERVTDNLSTRVIILRGEGKHFSAGADLDSGAFVKPGPGRAQLQYEVQRRYSRIIALMRACPQPIIALTHGAACGGGFSILLAADVRYAAPDARMNAAYLKIGLGGCDMGSSFFLPRLIGGSAASEYLLSGRWITADRALALGLVSKVVPQQELLDEGLAMAADMLRASPMGLRMTKDGINAMLGAATLQTAMAIEDRQQTLLLETRDHRAAVTAFKKKRAPVYRNQ